MARPTVTLNHTHIGIIIYLSGGKVRLVVEVLLVNIRIRNYLMSENFLKRGVKRADFTEYFNGGSQ